MNSVTSRDDVWQGPATTPDLDGSPRRPAQNLFARWWQQPCGGREVLVLALPLVVSTLSFALMHYCNRLFLTWHSTVSVAAVIQAGALSWVFYSFPLGLSMYTTTFVAQYYGAGQLTNIGRILWQAIWIGVLCVPSFVLLGWNLPMIFGWLGHSPEMQVEAQIYFRIVLFGLGTATIAEALTAYFVGVGRTRVVMVVNGSASLLNAILDFIFIFGWGFIPAMGIAGAALATTISIWFKLGLYIYYCVRARDAQRHGLFQDRSFNLRLTGRLLRFGAPQGFHFLLEGGAITLFIMLMGAVGKQASAATAIAFSANLVAFVPIMGLGEAVTTIVGREIGRRRTALAARATWTAMLIGIVYAGFFAVLYSQFPVLFVGLHEAVDGFSKPEVEAARWMLKFVAAYCIFDAIQLLFQAALKGAGDTAFIMLTTIVLSTTFVITGINGAAQFESEIGKSLWWWWALTGWIVGLSLAFGWRFWQGKWKRMSVIEHHNIESLEAAK